jgi:hypothetical protein
MLWVIGALVIAMFPQLASMPIHLVAITLLPICWRLLAEVRRWKPMPMALRVLATAAAVAVLVLTYGGLLGRRAAVSLLVLMLSLKLLETFKIRDARIVASLSLFLCGTQFLFSQAPSRGLCRPWRSPGYRSRVGNRTWFWFALAGSCPAYRPGFIFAVSTLGKSVMGGTGRCPGRPLRTVRLDESGQHSKPVHG